MLQPGRLVTRTEKWAQEMGRWREEFAQVDAKKLDEAQRERLRAALAAARAELDAVEAGLGASSPHELRNDPGSHIVVAQRAGEAGRVGAGSQSSAVVADSTRG